MSPWLFLMKMMMLIFLMIVAASVLCMYGMRPLLSLAITLPFVPVRLRRLRRMSRPRRSLLFSMSSLWGNHFPLS